MVAISIMPAMAVKNAPIKPRIAKNKTQGRVLHIAAKILAVMVCPITSVTSRTAVLGGVYKLVESIA